MRQILTTSQRGCRVGGSVLRGAPRLALFVGYRPGHGICAQVGNTSLLLQQAKSNRGSTTGEEKTMQSMARYGTGNLARAKVFYDAIAEILGATCITDRENVAGYKGPTGGMFMIGTPFEGEANAGNGSQVVFPAASRAVVDAVYAKAIELGGKCEGAPGLRGPQEMNYYAAYFRDLDGNKLTVTRQGVD